MRAPRDHALLDALDKHSPTPFDGKVWRVVRDGRDAAQGYASTARWSPGTFEVLYTSMEKSGAIAEVHFRLASQPVFPSKVIYQAAQLQVSAQKTIQLLDTELFGALNVDKSSFAKFDYLRTQEIGDAAQFLGFDGLIVPSARAPTRNLVLFTEALGPTDIQIIHSEAVNWRDWNPPRSFA